MHLTFGTQAKNRLGLRTTHMRAERIERALKKSKSHLRHGGIMTDSAELASNAPRRAFTLPLSSSPGYSCHHTPLVLPNMKTRPTIFLSGVTHEFGSFRDAVENEIEMKGVRP